MKLTIRASRFPKGWLPMKEGRAVAFVAEPHIADAIVDAVNGNDERTLELLAALEAIADDARTDTSQPHFSDMLVDAGVLSEAADALRKWGNRPKASQDGHENSHD